MTSDDEIEDNLLIDLFHSFKGKKTTKISYDQIKNNTKIYHPIKLENYYESKEELNKTKADTDLSMLLKLLNIELHQDKENEYGKNKEPEEDVSLSINQIKRLVYEEIIDEYQALLIWEFTIKMKSDENFKKLISSSISSRFRNITENDIYLLNIFPVKSFFVFISTFFVFILFYKYHKHLNRAERETKRVYIILLIMSFYYLYILYSWMYYLSSCLILVFFSLCLKNLTELIIIKYFKTTREAIDISKENPNDKMFFHKMIIIVCCGSIMSSIIMFKFNYFITYLIFYGIVLKFLNAFTNKFQIYINDERGYSADLLFHFVGMFNFLISNLYRNYKQTISINDLPDSFYIISELFTFITISSIFSFAKLLSLDWSNVNFSSENNDLEIKKANRSFGLSDLHWLILFFLGFILYFTSYKFTNYTAFLLSMHFFKHMFKLLGDTFKTRPIRLFKTSFFIFHILFIYLITKSNDFRLSVVVEIYSETFNSILKIFVKFVGIFYIGFIIYTNQKYIRKDEAYDFMKDKDLLTENNEFRKVEIISEKFKNKKKSIQIHWYTYEQDKLYYYDFFYILFDYCSNYLLIIFLVFIIHHVENLVVYKLMFGSFIILLISRVRLYYIFIIV